MALVEKGHDLIVAKDAIKDPYVFEFLELPKDKMLKERGLENKLVENIQNYLPPYQLLAPATYLFLDHWHYAFIQSSTPPQSSTCNGIPPQ